MSRINAICDADARGRSPILKALASKLSAQELNDIVTQAQGMTDAAATRGE